MLNRKAGDIEIKIFTSTNSEDLQNKFNEWCRDSYENQETEILDIQYQESDDGYSLLIICKY